MFLIVLLVSFFLQDGDITGSQFIANNNVYTARHVSEEGPQVGIDITLLGASEERGFKMCPARHKAGDKILLHLAQWPGEPSYIDGMVMGSDDDYSWARLSQRATYGMSGSPIVCLEHGGVIGVLSSLMIEDPRFIKFSWFYPRPNVR